MTVEGMRRRWRTVTLTAALSALALLSACTGQGAPTSEPPDRRSATPPARVHLSDIAVGSAALAEQAGLYICGDRIVASAPAGGLEGDAFAVFDPDTGRGEITQVELPRGMRPNARWLLTTQCVDAGGKPIVSVAYQEMPLAPQGGGGIRAAYSLEGERLWRRRDLNQPARVVEDVLVVGATAEQPETAVDVRTGHTLATFDLAVQARTVVAANRVVVRGLTGPPVLTTLTGDKVARLQEASIFTADGGLLFGVTPAELPDAGEPGGPPSTPRELTDASPSPSPTRSVPPAGGGEPSRGEVVAYSLRTGEPQWQFNVPADPLVPPAVEPQSGIVVVVGVARVAHGIDPDSGRQQWRTPTEMESPRLTAATGIVLFDRVEEAAAKLVDASTGLPLPDPEQPIVDLEAAGALLMIDGTPTLVSPARLRNPPTTPKPEPTD